MVEAQSYIKYSYDYEGCRTLIFCGFVPNFINNFGPVHGPIGQLEKRNPTTVTCVGLLCWSIPRYNSLSMHIFGTLDLIIKVPTAPWFFPGCCVAHKFEMQIHGPVQRLRLPHRNIYETVYFQDCFFFCKSLASHWATPTIGRLISTCEVFFLLTNWSSSGIRSTKSTILDTQHGEKGEGKESL